MATVFDKKTKSPASAGADLEPTPKRRPFILAVGEVGHWRASGRDLPYDSRIGFADFHDVTRDLIATLNPEIVLSPLLCGSFDCIDLAQTLHSIGFIGRYRVIVPQLPDPGIISSEITSLCPGLDFSLIHAEADLSTRLN